MDSILNLQGIEKEFSFQLVGPQSDTYFCTCGEHFLSSHEEEILELDNVLSDGDEDEYFSGLYKNIKLSMDKKIECPHCLKNYSNPENARKLIVVGSKFIAGYQFNETDTDLILYYAVSSPGVLSRKTDNGKEYKIVFDESIKYIRFEKNSGRLFFQNFGDSPEVEFDLDEVINYVEIFFENSIDKVLNLFSLHMYFNRLANFVSDTNSGKIVSEFLDHVKSVPNSIGIPYMKKLLAIFYGIIKYSNLSTVALTKDSQFLYDLMFECEIPKSDEMKKSGATSPVEIFNFLVTKFINKLNEEVNEDNKDIHDFTFKSKQRIRFENEINESEEQLNYNIESNDSSANFKIKRNNNYKEGKVSRVDGKFQVMDSIEDGTVSKFIYKNIRNFSDYKKIIKYFKFYEKREVITLMQKHDLELLTNAIDYIYFRDKMEIKELSRVLKIIDSFLEGRFITKDYKNIKDFSFVEYDDAKLMMEIMEFDPKRDFNKIDSYDELVKYHDLLVKYYKVKSEEERSGAINDFVSKFRYLETKGPNDYEGPLEIILHDNPNLIIKEGIEMKHSASAYAPKVAQGIYVLGSIYDRDPNRTTKDFERFTIGFTFDKNNGLEFDQVKSTGNKPGSDRFKKLVMDFLTKKDVSFRPVKDLKLKDEY